LNKADAKNAPSTKSEKANNSPNAETEQPLEQATDTTEPPALALDSNNSQQAGQTESSTETATAMAETPAGNADTVSAPNLPPGMRPPQLADQEKTNRIVLSAIAMLFGVTLLVAVGIIAFKATQKDKGTKKP
ncbi:MAG: hypothetical protein K2X81_16380, partial [Candidatus Obscuribacterales bacterium]|nr:hypothetical protein [Candidatus Obscuribacterales bacterium]